MGLQSGPLVHKKYGEDVTLLTFFDYHGHTSPTFKSLEVLKLQDIIQFSILKLFKFYFNVQLPLQV